MNKEQLRHTQSIARHMLNHVEQLQRDMQSLMRLTEKDVQDYSIERMEKRITTDVNHAIKEMQQVLSDMLPDLNHP